MQGYYVEVYPSDRTKLEYLHTGDFYAAFYWVVAHQHADPGIVGKMETGETVAPRQLDELASRGIVLEVI